MLIFIGPRRQTHLLRTMKRDARMPPWTAHTYSWLFRKWRLPAGSYIFVGVDRLDPGERRLAGQFYRHLNGLGTGFRALNDPARAMGRYRLLRTLHEQGINDFNAYLVAETLRPERYPVFIRRNSSSTPPLTGLIDTPIALDAEIDRLIAIGEWDEDLLIIEYCAEPIGEGIYRKQAEYRIADRYVPSPSIYAGSWYIKYSNSISVPDSFTDYDATVMARNPFAAIAQRVFEIAGVEYGRLDIGIVAGRPQIYEVNFNPDIRTQRERPNENSALRTHWNRSDDLVFEAMAAFDSAGVRSAPTISNDELRAFRLRFWRNYAPQRY